jgi:YggT family protein
MVFLADLINRIIQLIIIVVIIQAFLSFFMSPFHPVRQAIDRIVEPMLAPIRRYVPPIGMIDLSPLILIILLEILGSLITRLLISL